MIWRQMTGCLVLYPTKFLGYHNIHQK